MLLPHESAQDRFHVLSYGTYRWRSETYFSLDTSLVRFRHVQRLRRRRRREGSSQGAFVRFCDFRLTCVFLGDIWGEAHDLPRQGLEGVDARERAEAEGR